MERSKVYVTTSKSNGWGDWLYIKDYVNQEEYIQACRKLHSSEKNPKFFISQSENIPKEWIHEGWLIDEEMFYFVNCLENKDYKEREAFLIWMEWKKPIISDGIHLLEKEFQEDYVGRYPSMRVFAEEFIEYNKDLPEWAKHHFDYYSYAEELFGLDYYYEGGHVFNI